MTTDFAEQSVHELIYLLAVSFPKFFHVCVLQPRTTLCLQNVALSLTSCRWFCTDTQLGVRVPRQRALTARVPPVRRGLVSVRSLLRRRRAALGSHAHRLVLTQFRS